MMRSHKWRCNCIYCTKCDTCGHKADEHVAGESFCGARDCECDMFKSALRDAFDNRPFASKHTSFEDFANMWCKNDG